MMAAHLAARKSSCPGAHFHLLVSTNLTASQQNFISPFTQHLPQQIQRQGGHPEAGKHRGTVGTPLVPSRSGGSASGAARCRIPAPPARSPSGLAKGMMQGAWLGSL